MQRVVVLHVDVVVFETGNAKVVRSATCRDVNHDLGPRPGQGHFFGAKMCSRNAHGHKSNSMLREKFQEKLQRVRAHTTLEEE